VAGKSELARKGLRGYRWGSGEGGNTGRDYGDAKRFLYIQSPSGTRGRGSIQ